jgi:hypothetical protein
MQRNNCNTTTILATSGLKWFKEVWEKPQNIIEFQNKPPGTTRNTQKKTAHLGCNIDKITTVIEMGEGKSTTRTCDIFSGGTTTQTRRTTT